MKNADDPRHAMGRDSLGPCIKGYNILRELARGGQGIIYEALQESTNRKVVIKILSGWSGEEDAARKRFDREIDIAAHLKHPHIVTIFDSGVTASGEPYCAMEYVRGLPFDRHIRQHDLSLGAVLQLFAQVCEAVQHAHRRGVIHRDLKPSNVLVNAEEGPKILDFGIAKVPAAHGAVTITQTTDLIGTIPYMAPEQTRFGTMEVDTRADIYALGIMLYEALTGQFPYPVTGIMADVLTHIARTPPQPLRKSWSVDTGIPAREGHTTKSRRCPLDGDIDTIVMKCLAKEPDRRYQSAGELSRDIRHYLAHEPIEARRDSVWYLLRKELSRRRMPVAVVVGLAALMLASTTITVAALREQHKKQEMARLASEREEVRAFLAWASNENLNKPSEDYGQYKEILRGVCDRLRCGTFSPLDCEAFVRACFLASFGAHPFIQAGDSSGAVIYASMRSGWIDLSEGLGIIFAPKIKLDGQPIRPKLCPDGCLWNIPDSGISAYGDVGHFNMPTAIGTYTLSGTVDVRIAGITKRDDVPLQVALDTIHKGYDAIPGAEFRLQLPDQRFTIVNGFPRGYPPRIVGNDEVKRIREGFRVDQLDIVEEILGQKHKRLLNLRISFPKPRITMACKMNISGQRGRLMEPIGLVSTSAGSRIVQLGKDAPELAWHPVEFGLEGELLRLSVRYPLAEESLNMLKPGDTVFIAMTASEEDVRTIGSFITEYLDFELHWSGKVKLGSEAGDSH